MADEPAARHQPRYPHPRPGGRRTGGLGDVADARFARSFLQLQQAFEMPRVPTAAEVFDRRFLPPVAERRMAMK